MRQKLTKHDLENAIRLFEDSARQFQASGLPVEAAQAEREAGDTYLMTSNYGAALSSYRRALRFAPTDPAARCLSLSHIARTYATMGKPVEASRYSAEALALCGEQSDARTRADVRESEGETRFWAGDLDGAVGPLNQARDLFAEVKDDDGKALALLMLGYANANRNRDEAVRLIEDALRLWSSIGNRYGIAKAQLALGFFDNTSGQFARAQCDCAAALKVFHAIADQDNEAIAMNILGKVNRETGDLAASLDYFRRSKTDFARVHDELGEAEAITGMGQALTAMRGYRQLLPLYAEKLRLARRVKSGALQASALASMAEVYELEHRYAKADELYRRALATYRSAKHVYGESDMLIRLGYLQAEQGKDSDAISLLESARPLKENTGQVEEVAKIQYELAYIYRRMKQLEDARAEIEKTIEIIESQRLRIAKFDSRASYFASVHRYYSLYIQVLMALDQEHPGQGFAQRAFEASERSKVRSLLDLLTVSGQNSPCDEPSKESLNGDAAAQISNSGEVTAPSTTSSVLNLQQIQAAQDDDTILLEHALGDEASYLWVVERSQIVSHRLPPSDDLRKLVKNFLGGVTTPEPRTGETAAAYSERIQAASRMSKLSARQLSRALLGQVALPPEKRVLVVPDGFLQSIPFSALPLAQPGAKDAVLLTQHEVVTLPSASALAALRMATAKRAPPTSGIVVLADPVFELPKTLTSSSYVASGHISLDHSPVLKRALRDVNGSRHVPPLPGSREEAFAIQKVFGQETFLALGYEANRESVLNGLIGHHRVVHFATHGVIDVRHPEMSGLVLSMYNRQGKPQDGYLRLGDIYKLKLSADLVVLSSCESALGKELESEGIIGLPRGFLNAGARSVIASLWKVDDDATAALMQRLYARIRQGQTVSAALRGAQLDMAKDRRYSQPNWWAAFVLQGDYNYIIEFKTRL